MSLHPHDAHKREQADQLAADLARWLAQGGTVQRCTSADNAYVSYTPFRSKTHRPANHRTVAYPRRDS